MAEPLDLDALKKQLAEYEPDRERCDGVLKTKTNQAPDGMREDDPEYHDYDFAVTKPCCRPKGHSGLCRNSRAILGWPGRLTLHALVSEIECLREEVRALRWATALEHGEEAAALPGWHWNRHAQHWWSDHGWCIWRAQDSTWSTCLGRIKKEDGEDCPLHLRDSRRFHTVWDAMNAAPPYSGHSAPEPSSSSTP